jgi:hypothetical protein
VVQHREHARRVLDLAREEAEGFGHRYLGPEHLVLGVLRHGDSGASRVLRSCGVDLLMARSALRRLVDRGVVPGPRPSDAELLGSLGIDLEAIRRATEQTFGGRAVGWAVRDWAGPTPLRDPPMLVSQVLYHAGRQAEARLPVEAPPVGVSGRRQLWASVQAAPLSAQTTPRGRPSRSQAGSVVSPRRGPGRRRWRRQGSMIPCLYAKMTACTRSRSPSLDRTLEVWVLMVASLR